MFQYLSQHSGDLVAVRTTGKLGKDDLDVLLREMEKKIKPYGKVRFFWEMPSFEGWNLISFLQDRRLI